MKNVYIVAGNRYGEASLFKRLGYNIVTNAADADLAVFTGGADIQPALYGDKQHRLTYTNPQRDGVEVNMYHYFRERNVPMVGICRGGQLLNVMAGGRMYQHVDKHSGGHHEITDLFTGEVVTVNSIHHQMMMPTDKAVIIASAYLGSNREWMEGEVLKRDVSKEDIEVVFYPEIKGLCFQAHPEMAGEDLQPMVEYFHKLIGKYLGV